MVAVNERQSATGNQQFTMADDFIGCHQAPETIQEFGVKMHAGDFFRRFGAAADNFKNGCASLDVVCDQFIDPVGQMDAVPLIVVEKPMGWKNYNFRILNSNISEFF